MRTWGLIAIVAGLLLLAGVVVYLRRDSFPNDLGSRRDYDSLVMCRACGQSYPANIRATDVFPLVCEKCGKKEAWPQKQCYSCGNRFVPPPEGNPPHLPMMYKCPKCGSSSVGAATPGK